MNKRIVISVALLIAGAGLVRAADAKETSAPQTTERIRMAVAGPNPYKMDLGIGYNWFDYFGIGGYYARYKGYPLSDKVYPDMDNLEGWNAVKEGLDELRPGWFRFGIPADKIVDANGNLITNSIHFEHLKWLNDWSVKNGSTILLDPFLIPQYYEFKPLPEGTVDPGPLLINMAARDNKEYAQRFVVPLLDHVVNGLKLTSVKWFNPVNEAMQYGVYQTPNNKPDMMAYYVDMYKEMRLALDAKGIPRDRMGLVALETGPLVRLYVLRQHALGVDINPYVDAYSVHHYELRLDYLPPRSTPDVGRGWYDRGMNVVLEKDDKLIIDYTRSRGKPFWAPEMGTILYGKFSTPEGLASIDSILTISEGVIRGVNVGITTFGFWSIMNPNNIDGHNASMAVKDNKLVRSDYPYNIYGTLARAIKPGATIRPINEYDPKDISNVFATAIENKDGTRNILIVNDHTKYDFEATIDLPGDWKVNDGGAKIVARNILLKKFTNYKLAGGKLVITLPPFSLVSLAL